MIAEAALESVRSFLRTEVIHAFLVSEVVAGVRSSGMDEAEVIAVLRELERRGDAVWQMFPVRDPHLAFDHLDFVAGVDPAAEDARRQAEQATQRGFRNWLQAWLSGHRCS